MATTRPRCPMTKEVATAPIKPLFAPTGWKTVALEHISFQVPDYRKEAAFYIALMGWKLRSDDGKQAVLDIGDWGSAIFKAAPPEQKTVLVDGFGFAIEPWNAKTVEAELRKRDLNPVADNDGKGFESFHVKDPDGFDVQIGNSNGLVKARKTPATAKLEVELPFEATNWQTVWLDHFSFSATNYKASVSYYTNLLGWEDTYDEGSQNEVLMGDIGDAIIRGGNPNDPNFGKPPANGKSAAAERPHRSHLVWHPAVGSRRREGGSGEARAARPDRHRQHRRYPPDGLQELSHPDAQRIQPADELRHQGHTADRIDLDEACAVSFGVTMMVSAACRRV